MSRSPLKLTDLPAIIARFAIPGTLREAAAYGSGHINDTIAAVVDLPTGRRRYILQRINHTVFTRPVELMENIERVTTHLHRQLPPAAANVIVREALTLIPTRDGAAWHRTADGDYWRAYDFIEGATTHDVVSAPRQAFEAARAFGRFQQSLATLPTPPLHETIVDFHHTPKRLQALIAAIEADAHGRAASCRDEIAYALSLAPHVSLIVDGLADGSLPWRVTHNDTKINNVMLDDVTDDGLCVIDLDTVMPGSALYDFGDLVRTATGHFAENTRDLTQVYLDLERFGAVAGGYLAGAGAMLSPAEVNLLPMAGMLMTFEVGIRFLTDYLQGDIYFKIHRPGENLDRSRTQLTLVKDIMAHRAQLQEMVAAAAIAPATAYPSR